MRKLVDFQVLDCNATHYGIDLSNSYLKSYSKAKVMITDFSGTAFTFAYSTLKPVLFAREQIRLATGT